MKITWRRHQLWPALVCLSSLKVTPCEFTQVLLFIFIDIYQKSLPGRMNVMRPEVMAMEPKMRVGMMGLISARAATVVDRVPPT